MAVSKKRSLSDRRAWDVKRLFCFCDNEVHELFQPFLKALWMYGNKGQA